LVTSKGKRKRKSWGNLSTASVWRGNLLVTTNKEDPIMTTIANRITELERAKGDTLHDWQEFVYRRQEQIDKNSRYSDRASEPTTMINQLHELLKEQPADVIDAVTLLLLSATYTHYNKGFSDGMKIAMIVGNV
jgi:hypothetical protein